MSKKLNDERIIYKGQIGGNSGNSKYPKD